MIDTRDLEKRRSELEDELEVLKDDIEEAKDNLDEDDEESVMDLEQAQKDLDEWEDHEELAALNNLRDEFDFRSWRDGIALIPESEFKDYAMDLADDLHGSAVRNASWPFNCIDWEQAARDLAMDYSSVEYDGETYLYME